MAFSSKIKKCVYRLFELDYIVHFRLSSNNMYWLYYYPNFSIRFVEFLPKDIKEMFRPKESLSESEENTFI